MRYLKLGEVYGQLESTTKRLEKTHILSGFIKSLKPEEASRVVLLLQGRVFPVWDDRKIGVAAKLVLKAVSIATGSSNDEIEQLWKEKGDLGDVASALVSIKKQATLFSTQLTDRKVFDNLKKLSELSGQGTVSHKVKLIAELLTSAEPLEAKYIIRTVLEDLRVGASEGTLRDAIVWANFGEKLGLSYDSEKNDIGIKGREEYNDYVMLVQEAYDVSNDFSVVAKEAAEKGEEGLRSMSLKVGVPLKAMLALKAKDVSDAFARVGKPCALEYKYDGFRMQVHKDNDNILIFTRRLENVTRQFPDVVRAVKANVKGSSFILDCEAVGYDPASRSYLPFQNISQRIKRKYAISEMAQKFPVELNVFDIMYYDGVLKLKEPFSERRSLIRQIVAEKPRVICVAKEVVTSSEEELERFYKESLDMGNEGLMVKKLDSPYKPGARVGFWYKLKPVMEPFDLVIVGADWGEGKRANWLSSFTLACVDEDGSFLEVGKVGTGIKEKAELGVSFDELTKLLEPLIISGSGREVRIRPKIVVEVKYEEIQKSPTYRSGFALRFPRLARIREDKAADEASPLSMVKEYYEGQGK